jgi:CDP-4-dehydro-6-deoxyglucose reductase
MTDPRQLWINDLEEPLIIDGQETILETLERFGYRMRKSCKNGVCEVCEYQLISGRVDQRYPQALLNGDKQQNVVGLACTSRPLSSVRLKIKGLKRPGEQTVKRLMCDVVEIAPLNYDVFKVHLRLPATASMAVTFKAGQYLELVIGDRKAPFSIGSAPEAGRELELHIRQAAGSEFAKAVMDHLNSHSQVEIELPKGDCFLEAASLKAGQPVILAAASTGFSQMKSIMEHLLASGVDNPIHFYWGARIAADLYSADLPLEWLVKHSNVVYHPVVSEPGVECGWAGRKDLLPNAIKEDFTTLGDALVFASGSPAMVYALLDACEERGLPEGAMKSDVFAYAPRPPKA